LRARPGKSSGLSDSGPNARPSVRRARTIRLFIVSFIAAIFPALYILREFRKRDIFPEPPRVIWTTFGLGILCIIPALFLAVVITIIIPPPQDMILSGLHAAFLQAAIPEELAKFAVLYIYCARQSHFDEPMDGLVYGVTASLGFAAFENVVYVLDGGLGVALMRALTAVPSHGLDGAIMGYFIAFHIFLPFHKARYLALSLAMPILLHGLYDFPLMIMRDASPVLGFLPLVVLAVEGLIFLRLFRRFHGIQKAAHALTRPQQPT